VADGDVRFEIRDGVAWLTIDRPERRNALRPETIDALLEGLGRASGDDDVRAICVTGAGQRAFCAGADLAAGGRGPAEGIKRYGQLLLAMAVCPRPLVARVNGHCMGGGVGLMLSCDLAYAADDVAIGTPEVNVGLFPMMVAALLVREGCRKKLMEMVYTGGSMTALEAEQAGLLTRAWPRGELDEHVEAKLRSIASKAPLALGRGRAALSGLEAERLELALTRMSGELETLMRTEDAAEGMLAFAEKREPVWKGR